MFTCVLQVIVYVYNILPVCVCVCVYPTDFCVFVNPTHICMDKYMCVQHPIEPPIYIGAAPSILVILLIVEALSSAGQLEQILVGVLLPAVAVGHQIDSSPLLHAHHLTFLCV